METNKRLVMVFKTTGGKQVSLSVDKPREDVTEQEIKTVMTLILSSNIFVPNQEELASLVEAKIVTTNTTEYDLV